jgi:hypothetical protein
MNAETRPPKPAWGSLYAILGGIVALWIIAIRATPSAAGNRWLDLVFLVLLFGVIFLWVHANRARLAQSDQERFERSGRIVRIVMSPPPEVLPPNVDDDCASKNGQPIRRTEEYMVCLVISDRR